MFDLWGQVDRGRLTHDLVNSQVHDFVDFAIALSYETRDYSIIADGQRVFATRSFGVRNQHSRDHPRQARCVSQHVDSHLFTPNFEPQPGQGIYARWCAKRMCQRTAIQPHSSYLYYYRRAARKKLSSKSCPQKAVLRKLSSKFDEFLAMRSWRRFYAPTCCLSATFVRPLFAFVLCLLRQKIINNAVFRHRCDVYAAVFALDVATGLRLINP